ncbi:MAG: hypothetical protein WCQ64_14605, partial [Acidobacteriota bacterium]
MRGSGLRLAVVGLAILLVGVTAVRVSAFQSAAERRIARYAAATPVDAISRLQQRMDAGEVTLTFDKQFGYLPSLLSALQVPVSSQLLVFSKTSFQLDRIAPWSPRAVYFGDEVYVGWVQ